MSDSNAYIRDHQSLIDLNNTLEFSADAILRVLEQVDNYLQGVLRVLRNQVQILEGELRFAQDKLSFVEQTLRDCEASQRWDEEHQEYRPNCKYEADQVSCVRSQCRRCEERVELAKEIVRKCELEIEEYKRPGGFIIPAGGEKLMQLLAQEHTDKATEKMREILTVVEEYLHSNMSIRQCVASGIYTNSEERIKSQDTMTPEQKKERLKSAIDNVIDKMQRENNTMEQNATPNISMVCPNCKRARVACICPRQREKEYVRENMKFINNDFSR